jgi:GAF domain-containing protein
VSAAAGPPVLTVVVALDGRLRHASASAQQALRRDPGLLDRLVPGTALAAARNGTPATHTITLALPSGATALEVGVVPLVDAAGTPIAVVGVARVPPGPDQAAGTLDLARVVADVASTRDPGVLAEVVTDNAAEVLGADSASLCTFDGAELRLVGMRSARPVDEEHWRRVPAGASTPLADCVRLGQPVSAGSRAEVERRWPGLFPPESGERSVVAVPLLTGDRCVGAMGLSFPHARSFDGPDGRYLAALADSVAQALERFTVGAAAAEATRRLRFLADASAALAGSLDYVVTLQKVTDLAVPEMADWATVDLLEDGQLRRVAVSHIDPAKVRLAWELSERYPSDMDAPTGAPAVARTGATQLIEQVDAALLDQAGLDEERRRLVAELQLNSAMTVALRARGRTLGVLTFVYAESRRSYSDRDVGFAEDLARRAALAIDNSELHTETLQVARQLQLAVLPATFPDSATWQVAVHYRPAGHTDVGGDFYDATTLPDGRLVTFVGDVMGRGVQAASAMVQVRSALRGFLAVDPTPVSVVSAVDRMFAFFDVPQLVTLVYCLADPRTGEVQVVCAGHLPPLVTDASAGAMLVELAPGPPLGVGRWERAAASFTVAPGQVVVLYTDGLVERRGEDLDHGLRRLADAGPRVARDLSDLTLAGIAADLRRGGHDDDVTLLAFRALT